MKMVLPLGAVLLDALTASAWFDMAAFSMTTGIWGRKVCMTEPLHEGDRIEVYRPLTVDPKEARRLRYRAHGKKLSQ